MADDNKVDKLSRAAGAPVHIQFDGKTVPIRGALGVLAEVEQYLLGQLSDPIETVTGNLAKWPEHTHVEILKYALEMSAHIKKVDIGETLEYAMTPTGIGVIIWINMRQVDPEKYTLEYVQEKIRDMSVEEVRELIAKVKQSTGVDELGNEIGPTTSRAETAS